MVEFFLGLQKKYYHKGVLFLESDSMKHGKSVTDTLKKLVICTNCKVANMYKVELELLI